MMISPISVKNNFNLKFKANSSDLKPDNDKTKSKQNNSPDISFDSALYNQALLNKFLQNFDSDSFSAIDDALEFSDDDLSVADDISSIDDDFGLDISKISQSSALASIISLKLAAKSIGLPSDEIKDFIPHFVNFSAENYLKYLENSLTGYGLLDNFNHNNPDAINKVAADEGDLVGSFDNMMGMVLQSVQQTIKALSDYKPQLQDALDDVARANDYMIYKALINGFNFDARQVILSLTSDSILAVNPKITDKDDGTLIYDYSTPSSFVRVIRNKDNLDYISAVSYMTGDPRKIFDVQFNEDGSIKKLEVKNDIDGTNIIVSQDKNSHTAKVQQINGNLMADRSYVLIDGKLKQTSFNLLPYKK